MKKTIEAAMFIAFAYVYWNFCSFILEQDRDMAFAVLFITGFLLFGATRYVMQLNRVN